MVAVGDEAVSAWTRLRLWWYRRRLHPDCAEVQLILWLGGVAPHGACAECYPRVVRIRDLTAAPPRAAVVDRSAAGRWKRAVDSSPVEYEASVERSFDGGDP